MKSLPTMHENLASPPAPEDEHDKICAGFRIRIHIRIRIRINLSFWIWMLIRIQIADPDPGGQK